jgi:hypothetical protein
MRIVKHVVQVWQPEDYGEDAGGGFLHYWNTTVNQVLFSGALNHKPQALRCLGAVGAEIDRLTGEAGVRV